MIDSSPGIHYEKIGVLNYCETNWKLVTYLDYSSLETLIGDLENYYSKTVQICLTTIYGKYSSCNKTISLLGQTFQKLIKQREELKQLVSHRTKRAWFNIIGSAFKTIIGTLDEDDAEYYSEAIKNVADNSKHSIQLLNEQTQIVQSTITIFNETISNINSNINIINRNFQKFKNYTTKLNETIWNIEISQNLENHIDLLNIILNDAEKQYATLINSILFAKTNTLHPDVLLPSQLIDELKTSIQFLPTSLTYPVPLVLENVNDLYNLIKLTAFQQNNQLIFIIDIPLITTQPFNLYKLTPLPMSHDTIHYVFIAPTSKYLSVSFDKLFYSSLDSLDSCHKSKTKYVCNKNKILEPTGSNPICEVDILLNFKVNSNCNTRIVSLESPMWTKLEEPNSWLYVSPKPKEITISCKNFNVVDLLINGTGLLNVIPNCKIYTGEVTFYSNRKYSSDVKFSLPRYNILTDFNNETINKIGAVNIEKIPVNRLDLHDLNIASHKLKSLNEKTSNLMESFKLNFHTTASFLSYIVSIIIVIFILFKLQLFKYCRILRNLSLPVPRIEPENVELNNIHPQPVIGQENIRDVVPQLRRSARLAGPRIRMN